MIKRVRELRPTARLTQEGVRVFLENFESEILRGISTLTILTIINEHENEGTYGYEILKELSEKTNSILIIEDGTLYPILKKLQKEEIVKSEKKSIGGRMRTYYTLTEKGTVIYNHLQGFLTKLIESISPLYEIEVSLKEDRYLYCPVCANKIDMRDGTVKFCEMCGLNIEDLKKEVKE